MRSVQHMTQNDRDRRRLKRCHIERDRSIYTTQTSQILRIKDRKATHWLDVVLFWPFLTDAKIKYCFQVFGCNTLWWKINWYIDKNDRGLSWSTTWSWSMWKTQLNILLFLLLKGLSCANQALHRPLWLSSMNRDRGHCSICTWVITAKGNRNSKAPKKLFACCVKKIFILSYEEIFRTKHMFFDNTKKLGGFREERQITSGQELDPIILVWIELIDANVLCNRGYLVEFEPTKKSMCSPVPSI